MHEDSVYDQRLDRLSNLFHIAPRTIVSKFLITFMSMIVAKEHATARHNFATI
jgi:hypothetical protein